MTLPYRQLYIDGKWCDAASGKRHAVVNPATEEAFAEVAFGNRDDCRRAIEAASKAMPAWRKLTAWDRAKILKRVAELIRERADKFARDMTMEQGKPVAEAKMEVMQSADTFEWFAEEAKRAYGQVIPNSVPGKRHLTIKHPVGVVGTIGPSSEIGDEIMTNDLVKKVSFTGSTEVGKHLMRQAAGTMKRLSLELGGHAPFIVFPDADPEVVAKAAVMGKFRNNGQVCISPSRFFVHTDIRKKFTEVAVEEAKKLKLGNGLDDGTQIGPMFEKKAMENTQGLIADATGKGAKLLTGGKRSAQFAKGYFFEPAILDGLSADARVLSEEPFAPVMPILDFGKIDDVIAAANSTKYGLAAYVFTNDITVAFKMAEGIEAGTIGINDPVPVGVQCPFGGMKESGLGRELSHEGLEAYLETKHVSFKLRD